MNHLGSHREYPCLVTGGAGFIGRHVAEQLLQKGRRVVVLDDLSGGFRDNIPASCEFVEGSIVDRRLVDELFKRHRFMDVFHLAAYAAENLSHFIKHFNYENNLLGSINLINASVNYGVECFVFTSSAAIYGTSGVLLTEDSTPQPEDSYGIAKLAVERELHVSQTLFGLNHIVLRPHNVYGEHQNTGDPYRNVIGIFMKQLVEGQPLTIFGDGEQTRAFTHVEDIAPVIANLPNLPHAYNQVFNLGSDEFCSLNRLASLVQRAYGKRTDVIHLPPRHEVTHVPCSHEKAKRLLGYRPQISLEEGIARMVAWVKKQGVRSSRPFSEIEIWKNMPPSWMPAKTP